MPSGEARKEILEQHSELRGLLPDVEELAKRFERADGDALNLGAQLCETARALYEKFGAHLDREQELLEPLLRAAGPRGEQFLRRLEHEHDEQRELLDYLLRRLRDRPEPSLLIARELQNFAGFLRIEMDHEEQTLLAPDLIGGVAR